MKMKFPALAWAILPMISCTAQQAARNDYESGLALPSFTIEGHRGIRGLMPENTIASMRRAIDFDVNVLEVDVVISNDRKVVVSHDIYFHADISTTPDGKYLTDREDNSYLLYNMTYDSLKKYDVGLKPHKDFPGQQKIAAHKPLLADLIDSADAYARQKGKRMLYNIELKTNAAYDGKTQPPVEETVDLVMRIVREKKLGNRCYLQSFDFRPLQILHRKHPEITTAVLISDKDKRSFEQQLDDLGFLPAIYSPHFSLVTEKLVADCHSRKMKLIPWTVNEPGEMNRLKSLGIDGIITDHADRALGLQVK